MGLTWLFTYSFKKSFLHSFQVVPRKTYSSMEWVPNTGQNGEAREQCGNYGSVFRKSGEELNTYLGNTDWCPVCPKALDPYWLLQHSHLWTDEGATLGRLILQMRYPKHREGKWFIWDHTASMWWSQDSNPATLAAEFTLLSLYNATTAELTTPASRVPAPLCSIFLIPLLALEPFIVLFPY